MPLIQSHGGNSGRGLISEHDCFSDRPLTIVVVLMIFGTVSLIDLLAIDCGHLVIVVVILISTVLRCGISS